MSTLRTRMEEAMLLRGFAERTRQSYLACVTALARQTRQSPEQLDAAAIQAYLLHHHVGTTMRYFHLAQTHLTGTTSPLELLPSV